ncbi:NAD(P)-binding protein [Gemmatimonas groenlandica]|uniref:NAD(P)-binding protein n=1 Tax=Gemmatimonas groenlandica TaxID=2732249 RepID=A0A6M4IQV9_9BACT|nr:NAD(P)-binding protein [Gemmatimonas groenlandica]QJR35786.1 NAD(P)-binding protein [Gemmatimonas groenlandica]
MMQTDYVVVGAGAAGMAITDALLTHTDATVTMVDRRHAPGGHWIDTYPYVRLHQPSAFYGVDSTALGQNTIDTTGLNAGFYERASADEIRSYYGQVMQHRFLASGRVRYFPNCEYLNDQRVGSRVSGAIWELRAARKVIDTTYLEGDIPATSPPPFEVADGVRCVPAGAITHLQERPETFVVIGGGKTALDACVWLLEQGVAPEAIRWVKPRESWWINRKYVQPATLLPDLYRGHALHLEATAQATSVRDLFARLEAKRFMLRVDTEVEPSMYRGAFISETELDLVRTIKNVVRLGHVRRIDQHTITLDQGQVPTSARSLHIHCAARALPRPELRPMFEPDRITVQPFMRGLACFQFAMVGVAEALLNTDDEKNRVLPPINYWDSTRDSLTSLLAGVAHAKARADYPALAAWANTSRLNPMGDLGPYRDHPDVLEARALIQHHSAAAYGNMSRLIAM